MGTQEEPCAGDPVVAIYRHALPQVYGYLLPRCGNAAVAEDLTAETFMVAVTAAKQRSAPDVNVAWLVGVARHKLVDHWRRMAREKRSIAVAESAHEGLDDPWADWLDAEAAHAALSRLSVHHRAALTLRYLDGLPVAEVAGHFGRSLRATETLLARARAALRRVPGGGRAMTPDPLDALRLPIVPVDPRPEFAAALLRRIEGRQEPPTGGTASVRYFVDDLETAVAFYCQHLGFEEELRPSPVFAMLYRGDLRLLLSVPGRRGTGQALPDGTLPEPGGWNRIALHVRDLAEMVEGLRRKSVRISTGIVTGVGVKQVLLQDPSGNPIELFEPLTGYHERTPNRIE